MLGGRRFGWGTYIGTLCNSPFKRYKWLTKDISYVKYVERYLLQLQTCASISSPPWGETINRPKLVLIVAPVSIRKTRDGEHWWSNKKVFKCVLMLFPLSSMNKLFTWAFLLCWITLWASLRCGKAYVSSRLWVCWNVCHNFFNVCIGKAFTCVSFYVYLQVVYTKKRFYAYFTCRKPFCSKQWQCRPSNSSDIRKLLHIICICQHFSEIWPLPSVSFHVHLQVVSTRKRFST